jgi:hypothetical protein
LSFFYRFSFFPLWRGPALLPSVHMRHTRFRVTGVTRRAEAQDLLFKLYLFSLSYFLYFIRLFFFLDFFSIFSKLIEIYIAYYILFIRVAQSYLCKRATEVGLAIVYLTMRTSHPPPLQCMVSAGWRYIVSVHTHTKLLKSLQSTISSDNMSSKKQGTGLREHKGAKGRHTALDVSFSTSDDDGGLFAPISEVT